MAHHPSRRQFVQGLGVASLGLLAGCGRLPFQSEPPRPTKVPRVGLLTRDTPEVSKSHDEVFRQGLREYGWVEGENIIIEWRYGDGSADPLPGLAAELVALPVDVMVTRGAATPVTRQVTDNIPIVMLGTVDPIEQGLIASLARPGGNITGVSTMDRELTAKRLELLREGVPGLSQVAVLWSGTNSAVALAFQTAEAAASTLHVELQSVEVQNLDELPTRFDDATRGTVGGLLVLSDSQMRGSWGRIMGFARQRGLPTMFPGAQSQQFGGLLAYGPDLPSMSRRSAYYVDRILKGTRPVDLPVERPMRFEFIINLRTAQALGLTIPPHVLLQATEIIQ
jgi:putative tryptophan/tyrosine transport system substrate-binding protein